MITLLTGDNSFEIREALRALEAGFDGQAERIDGTELELRDIPDLLMGSTLFAERRLVIIRDLSQNGSVWEKLPEWLPRVSDDIDLVLVDVKPDKRTVAYKEIKKVAEVREFSAWTDRDKAAAEAWVAARARALGMAVDKKTIRTLLDRVGMDQWQLAAALDKLSVLETVDASIVESVIDANPEENVFQLFETALEGKRQQVQDMLRTLELTEDPYKLFALLSSQAFQLAAVAFAGNGDSPAKDLAIHPYVAQKLSRHARQFGKQGAARVLKAFAQADADMKTSRGEPWLLIERALLSFGN